MGSFWSRPSSTMGTSSGQALASTRRWGSMAQMARSYAPEATVASVPMTPMGPALRASAAAALGRMTSTTSTAAEGLQRLHRRSRGRVARDHQELGGKPQQEGGVLDRVLPHGRERPDAVGHAGRIAQIDDVLPRHRGRKLPHDRQPAQPGIEHADWGGANVAGGFFRRHVGQTNPARPRTQARRVSRPARGGLQTRSELNPLPSGEGFLRWAGPASGGRPGHGDDGQASVGQR